MLLKSVESSLLGEGPVPGLPGILRCPMCKVAMEQTAERFHCHQCRADYPVMDGIPDLVPRFMDERVRQMADSWNGKNYDYEEFMGRHAPERLQAIDGPLLAQCGGGRMVLEVGCGTGRLKKPVEQAGSRYIGLDPSLKLLQHGAAQGERDLMRGVGEYLPFPAGCFDTVIGGGWSFRYPQLDRLYPECARVLKSGGVLAFTVLNNWVLFAGAIVGNVKRGNFQVPKLKPGELNDVVSPAREVKRLGRFGFTVDSILSTRYSPALKKLPFAGRLLSYDSYWRGALGALVGFDVIFICRKH